MRDKNKRALENLRERIEASEQISDEDCKALLRFSDVLFLLKTKYSVHRHVKLLRHCTLIAENVGGLNEALTDREAAEEILGWINRNYDNEETNRDYRSAIRVFGKRLADDGETPSSISWIPTGTSTNYKPKPKPSEMLHWEADVLPMIEATQNPRDAALIAVAWDSGARSGEIQSLRVGDVTDADYGLQITVDGKVGQRTVTLISSVPYLTRWLQSHPRRKDETALLWCKLSTGEEMSYQMFRNILNQAADRAGVTKPVTLTNFRKSSASYLASRNVNQATIEDHHGWKRGSDVASRYISVFGKDSERAIARAHGVDVELDEPAPIGPLTCPRCDRETPRNEEFCVWCRQALEHGAIESVKDREREVREAVFRLAQQDPGLLTERERIDSLITLVETKPDLLDDAERFLDALETAG